MRAQRLPSAVIRIALNVLATLDCEDGVNYCRMNQAEFDRLACWAGTLTAEDVWLPISKREGDIPIIRTSPVTHREQLVKAIEDFMPPYPLKIPRDEGWTLLKNAGFDVERKNPLHRNAVSKALKAARVKVPRGKLGTWWVRLPPAPDSNGGKL